MGQRHNRDAQRGADPFGAVLGQRRGLSPEQSAGFRPAVLDRGLRCAFCELSLDAHDEGRCRADGRRACAECFSAEFIACADCGAVEEREPLRQYEHELTSAYSFELDLAEPLCRRHTHDAYADASRDERPAARLPADARRLLSALDR